MRPEDVRTPEDFQQWLTEHRARIAEEYRTPLWERVLLWAAVVAMVLVVASGIVSVVLR